MIVAKIKRKCEFCEAPVVLDADQTSIDGRLSWYYSSHCSNCDSRVEFDDTGTPPDEFRDAIIETDGLWELHVDDQTIGKAAIVKTLRGNLGWSLAEAAQALAKAPGPMYTGTKTETEWLQQQLLDDKISAQIVRVS